MQITLYQNFSKRQNSTKQPTGGSVCDVVMKRECSILNPVFLLDGVDPSVNYCRWNGRYYFINDIVLQNNNIYELRCDIDVLATWKTQIGASSQYVLRSASAFDGNVVDGFYPAKKQPVAKKHEADPRPSWAANIDSGYYVIGIISGTGSQGGTVTQGTTQYYCMSPGSFNTFAQNVFTEANWTNFQSADRYSFNPVQYIASVMWFPVLPPVSGQMLQGVKVGWENIACTALVMTDPIFSQIHYFDVDDHPQAATRGNYLNSAPYSEYILKFPPFPDTDIDGDIISMRNTGASIMAQHSIDMVTGRAQLRVSCVINSPEPMSYELGRREVQLGVNIQIAQIAVNRIGVAQGIISTAAGFVSSLLTGNVPGLIAGTASGILSAYQTAQPRVSSAGSNDTLLGVLSHTEPYLYEIFHQIVDEDNDDYGRPLCETRILNTLSGYILCSHAEIDIPGLPAERDQIMNYLDSGFFYE